MLMSTVMTILLNMIVLVPLILTPFFLGIAGDGSADISLFPFEVTIDAISIHLCSGTIVTEFFILTEHSLCTSSLGPSTLYVKSNLSVLDSHERGIPVDSIYPHPQYDFFTHDYDISILKLTQPLVFGIGVQPAILPDASFDLPEGTSLVVTGWRQDDIRYEFESWDAILITNEDCRDDYQQLTNRMICTICGQKVGLQCTADHGGSLVTSGNVLLGLFKEQNFFDDIKPAVFTRITAVRDFITDVTGV